MSQQSPLDERPARVRPGLLFLATGLPDDRRAPLREGHALYPFAALVHEVQDDWSPDEIAAHWRGALPHWPRLPNPPVADRLARLAAYLNRCGLEDAAIADVFAVERDSLRRREYIRRGEDLGAEWAVSIRLGSLDEWAARSDELFSRPWLPRVYSIREEAPVGWPALPDPAPPKPPAVIEQVAQRAHERLRGRVSVSSSGRPFSGINAQLGLPVDRDYSRHGSSR